MTTLTYAATDAATMLRRNIRRMIRYPSLTLMVLGLPVLFLLMFVFVFGQTLGTGLGGPSGGRAAYATYVTPGILLMALAGAVQGTAIAVAMDMHEGIIARFRTMAISRSAVLTGHVVGSMIQSAIAVVVVLGLALLVGFRPHASALDWAAAAGLLALIAMGMAWLTVAMGLVSKSVETASNMPMPLTLLPFFGSGFVPPDTMPTGLAWFADHQPFTPLIETLRGLLLGTPLDRGLEALLWALALIVVGYLWARRLYARLQLG
jgi:ABC-2 type transport system permease protein